MKNPILRGFFYFRGQKSRPLGYGLGLAAQVFCSWKPSRFLPGGASFVFCFILYVGSVFAQSVPSSELIANTRKYDGKMISFQGEVIGDIMPRKKFVWLNVFDGKNAIGIWAASDLVKGILYSASYTTLGDQIKIRGIFNRRCAQHGGDMDIHAFSIEKVHGGVGIHESINKVKLFLAIVLGGVCLILILIRFRKS